ncbi:sensor histidine kinase [Jannaschia marina]|uniref:sensor histidine kinase n=1 Tax=Jannaschia marina TaxID=2741674 RepID=UPI0015CEA945|nr:sensor histidine kinase [Jannaschia marina]
MAALLSIALFPIGLVAVMQTQNVAVKSQRNAELYLLALTEQAAVNEREVLNYAQGAARVLANSIELLLDDPEQCSALLRRAVTGSDLFSFGGFLPLDGMMTCSTIEEPFDFSNTETFRARMAEPSPSVSVQLNAPISGIPVLIVSMPVYASDDSQTFLGYVTLSVPHSVLRPPDEDEVQESLVSLITFNHLGEILTTTGERDAADAVLPENRSLTNLLAGERQALTLMDRSGTERIYTVSTIEPGQVYALGIWDSSAGLALQTQGEVITAFFPALMWLAGLAVALIAVHRLVTRHLQVLGRQMALFTAARRLPDAEAMEDPPTEIRRIQRAFLRMTAALVRDEASLENAVREKSVLVKEIHHRVKNNLQLISSIINMQVREVASNEAKQALRQTQDRVLSMATIHRDLYQTNETGLVDVGHLVQEVVGKTIEINADGDPLDVETEIEGIWLYPDQAVPMSLLASEAVINALKHMPAAADTRGRRFMSVRLTQLEDRTCIFECENSAGCGEKPTRPRGMGRRLIQAFATQLGAETQVNESDGRYHLHVTFTASEFAPAPGTF